MSSAEAASITRTLAPTRWRPDARGWVARLAALAGIFGLVIWITATVADFWADRISLAVIYAIIGLSLNVVMGYTGQVSLGHHAFVGLAAFTSAYYVTEKAGCNPDVGCEFVSIGAFSIGLLLAVLSGVISAGLLGMVALRIKGLYLALITLTYGFVAINSLFEIPFLTRGGAGMPAARPEAFAGDAAFAFMCMGLLALVLFIDWRFLRSKVGRAVLAVKESEPVAATYAVNVTAYKVMAFMMSGAFAGLAGALFAHRRGIVVAVDFTFSIALLWVLMVVVGGLGNRTGVVIGSAFFALFPFLITLVGPLDSLIRDVFSRDPEEFTLIIGPLLAVLTIILYPGGIAEQISPITRWLGGARFSMHPEGHRKKARANLLVKLGLKRVDQAPATSQAAEATQEIATTREEPAPRAAEEAPDGRTAPAPSSATEAPTTTMPAARSESDEHAAFKPPTASTEPEPEPPQPEPEPETASEPEPEPSSRSDEWASLTGGSVAPERSPAQSSETGGNGRTRAFRRALRSAAAKMQVRSRRVEHEDPEWPDVLRQRKGDD